MEVIIAMVTVSVSYLFRGMDMRHFYVSDMIRDIIVFILYIYDPGSDMFGNHHSWADPPWLHIMSH